MANDPILHLLGLAKKAGRLEVGEEPVGAACRARQARLVLLAADAAPNTRRRCAHFGQAGDVLWLELPFSKEELGFQLGRSSCAMLALTDAGFAAAVTEKLAVRDPDKYGPAAARLRTKADRVLQRQKEQRQHEKNLQQGKKKPWAPPPAEKKDSREGAKPPAHKPAGGRPATGRHRSAPGRAAVAGTGPRRLTGKLRRKPEP